MSSRPGSAAKLRCELNYNLFFSEIGVSFWGKKKIYENVQIPLRRFEGSLS